MTKEGRLARGKENYERGRFLNNPETLEYLESLDKTPEKAPKQGRKPKED
jgi:hypothetical protein